MLITYIPDKEHHRFWVLDKAIDEELDAASETSRKKLIKILEGQ